jgi:hypothetical protein
LWAAVETDWDGYRIWHALRGLAGVGDKTDLERLISLGDQPLLRIHWQVIEEAAAQAGVPIPPHIRAAQQRLDEQRGSGDFYHHFEARRPVAAEEPAVTARTARTTAKEKGGFPPAFSAEGETNAFLSAYKESRAGRWSLTRMEPLFEAVDLAVYLIALDRPGEALEVVSFLSSSVAFTGNYNIWTPVGYALCWQARLHRLAGDTARADAALQRVREHPFLVNLRQERVGQLLDRARADIDAASREKTAKAACHKLARALDTACFFVETGHAGFPWAGWYSVPQGEALVMDGLGRMGERLRAG